MKPWENKVEEEQGKYIDVDMESVSSTGLDENIEYIPKDLPQSFFDDELEFEDEDYYKETLKFSECYSDEY